MENRMPQLRIDLHTRSSRSDGAVSPAGLMTRASAAGLGIIALTDLDSTAGLAEAAKVLPAGLTLLPAVAVSCTLPDGDRRPAMDLLAYGADAQARDLVAMLHTTREGREQRSRQIVALLAAGGHPIRWADVAARAGSRSPDLSHIAAELVHAGLVATPRDAFTPEWIGHGGLYWRPKTQPTVSEALRAVRAAGGVPILAYPCGGRGPRITTAHLTGLTGLGLAGIEVDRPDAGSARRRYLRDLAAGLGLIVTGGSGFRGGPSPHALGADTTTADNYARILALGATPITRR